MSKSWVGGVLLLSLGISTWAHAGQLSVMARKSLPEGIEETALVFDGSRAIWVRNSNFLIAPAKSVELGRFESDLTPPLRAARERLSHFWLRLERERRSSLLKGAPLSSASSPHRVRWFVGTQEVGPESPYFEAVRSLLLGAQGLAGWRPTDTRRAELGRGCEAWDDVRVRCRVDGYGVAYLKK